MSRMLIFAAILGFIALAVAADDCLTPFGGRDNVIGKKFIEDGNRVTKNIVTINPNNAHPDSFLTVHSVKYHFSGNMSHCHHTSSLSPEDELVRVKELVVKLDSEIRNGIKKHIESDATPTEEIHVMSSTHLHGMCGDKITAVNVKFGAVFYHVYILDEGSVPQVVKILGPKETSIEITGFN